MAHRYWRIQLNSGAGGAYAFSEVQFRTTRGTALLFASATPATAAQTFGTVPGSFDATQAADNNTATLWSSSNKTPPQWWAYDYGATSSNWLDVVEVAITARNDGSFGQAPSTFDLQYSDDNSNWNTVFSFTAAAWTSAAQTQIFSLPPPQPQLPWHSLLTDQKHILDQAVSDEIDAYSMLQQQRLMRGPAMWGGPIIGGVYVPDIGVSKFVQYAVLGMSPGIFVSKFLQHDVLSAPAGVSVSKFVQYDILGMGRESISKFVQYLVLDLVAIPPAPPSLIGYQFRSIPGIDIGNDETPNLNLLRRQFVSADVLRAPAPIPSRLLGYQIRSIPGIDVGNEETPNLTLARRRFVSPDTYLSQPAAAFIVMM
jgi:hypothetical protein